MHRFSRSTGALAAVAAISALTVAGCGSDSRKAVAGGASATPTTTAATSASGPAGAADPATASNPADAAPAPSTTSSSASGVANRSACPGLAEKLVPLHGAASGTTFTDLVATNYGVATCILPAQPKLEYLDARNQTLLVAFSPNPQAKPYNLAPGSSAVMVVGYGSDGNGPCVTIASVRVAPSGDDLTYTNRNHCEHDGYTEDGWVAGTYAAPS